MSISNPKPENPCKKFIDFKGDKGVFVYYDKEQEKQVEVPVPIYFIVLDELATISGYNKQHDCGIYSNEVRRTADELLRVKTFSGGEEIIGLYSDIKDNIKALGGKYTKSVYALLINADKSTEMVNFKFRGASFSGWLEKKFNVDRSAVGIVGFKNEVNGKITYMIPVFKKFNMTPELKEKAIQADIILQEYLTDYFKGAPLKSTETALPDHISARVADDTSQERIENKDYYNQLSGGKSDVQFHGQPQNPFGDDSPSNEELSDLPF